MKRIQLFFLLLCAAVFVACDDDSVGSTSLIEDTPRVENDFDKWIMQNYVHPYNIDFKYRMEDIESDMSYNLIPADYNNSVALAKLVKYLWLEAYDELLGVDFLRTYVPRIIHLVGSPAFNSNGSMVLGTAEGGLKVTLYNVNSLDPNNISVATLNSMYLQTMHHEFAHILHQTKDYPVEFKDITGADYVGDDCFTQENTLSIALRMGFVSRYARKEASEDFVEVIAIYVTSTETEWNRLLTNAGTAGADIIGQKFEMVKNYLLNSWDIDIDKLRQIVQRRSGDIGQLNLTL